MSSVRLSPLAGRVPVEPGKEAVGEFEGIGKLRVHIDRH